MRAMKGLDSILDHYHGKLHFYFLPAHCGHHLHPIEGFWRVMKDAEAWPWRQP